VFQLLVSYAISTKGVEMIDKEFLDRYCRGRPRGFDCNTCPYTLECAWMKKYE